MNCIATYRGERCQGREGHETWVGFDGHYGENGYFPVDVAAVQPAGAPLPFQVASGSVTGTSHRFAGRSNQDGSCIIRHPDHIIAVVTDGCNDGAHSDVGAKLGARMIASGLDEWLRNDTGWDVPPPHDPHEMVNDVRRDVLVAMTHLLTTMGAGIDERDVRHATVVDFLLFTVVAVIMTSSRFVLAKIGDGRAMVNGHDIDLGKYSGNAPPYLGYALTRTKMPQAATSFRVMVDRPTYEVQSWLIGTDGCDALAAAEGQPFPSRQPTSRVVVPIREMCEADRFYGNADAVRRYLTLANGGVGPQRVDGGLLDDDTTLVMGRRAQ